MQKEQDTRTIGLVGEHGFEKIHAAKVAIFGLGGVGSFATEALCRAGVGELIIIDNDTINKSNINRQLYALHSTVGYFKTEVAKKRIQDINPDCKVLDFPIFYGIDSSIKLEQELKSCDYIIDAIDTVSAKLLLIEFAKANKLSIISCMGTGNKLDPSLFKITDIYKTAECPLARIMRKECKKRRIRNLQVLYSTEQPIKSHRIPKSISFVPSTAGLLLAGEVLRNLLKK